MNNNEAIRYLKTIPIFKEEITVERFGGGLSNYKDLRNLNIISYTNLEGVIAGKSYYSGAIKIDKALKILKSNA